MKQNLSRLLILVLAACLLFALASCSIKFGSSKSTTAASTSTPAGTATGDATDAVVTNPDDTAEDTEPAPATTEPAPATTEPAPSTSGRPVGEDTDDNFGPLHPF